MCVENENERECGRDLQERIEQSRSRQRRPAGGLTGQWPRKEVQTNRPPRQHHQPTGVGKTSETRRTHTAKATLHYTGAFRPETTRNSNGLAARWERTERQQGRGAPAGTGAGGAFANESPRRDMNRGMLAPQK